MCFGWICAAMKLLMLSGGVMGFGIGLFFSRAQENSWSYSLWQASLASYAGGWLMGWWGRSWQSNLKEEARERMHRPAPTLTPSSNPKPSKT